MDVLFAATILAQEAAEEEARNPIVPDLSETIVGALAFLVLLWVLSKFAFPRIQATLKERTEGIEGQLDRAERERQQAQELLEQYRQRLDQAAEESQRIVEEARANAERLRRELATRAEQEADRIVERGRQELRRERDQAVRSLRGEVATLAVELATRVVGESLDRSRQLRLVDQYIDEIESTGAVAARGDGSAGDGG